MTTSPQPKTESAADERIWNLTVRTRSLVQRVQREIVEPTRKNISDAERRLEQARSTRQTAVAQISSQAAQPRSQTERLFQTARDHLTKQGADPGEFPKSLDSSSSRRTQDGASIDEAQRLVADLKRVVEEDMLKTARPKAGWHPDSEGAGCGLVIAGIIAGSVLVKFGGGFVGFILGFGGAYLAIMLLLHQSPVSRLRSTFLVVHRDALRILGMLEGYSTGMTAKAEDDLRSAEKRFKAEIAAIDSGLREPSRLLHSEIASLWADTGFAGAEWAAEDWAVWTPASSPAFAARFGKLAADTTDLARHLSSDLRFVVPALAPFPDGRSLLCKVSGSQKDRAASAIQSLLAHLLATIPPAKLRFTFVDPIALGSNVAAFMTLADHEESLVRCVSTILRHSFEEFSEYFRLTLLVC